MTTESEAIPRVSFTTLVIHDRSDFGPHLTSFLGKQDLPARFHATKAEALEDLNRGGLSGVEVVVIHKDFSRPSTDDLTGKIVKFIQENSPTTRVIAISGQWPDGAKHALQMRVDAYCPPLELDWLLIEIKKGALTPDQIELRGKPEGLSMPPEEEPLPLVKLW